MTHDELNQYILHYLTEDRTQSAMMLTGGWGTGKSYYIQNNLIPFLANRENDAHHCIVVPLYGVDSITDVSRNIYWGLKTEKLSKWWKDKISSHFSAKRKGMGNEAAVIGKTLLSGLAGKAGLSAALSDKELKELYDSIDLSGKLIIFEDLERSGIGILEVLGYVNNLVEQDGVKVLLVANEQEILKKEMKIDIYGREREVYTKEAEEYLRTKEKTVSDTVQYEEDFSTAIQEIIKSFGNTTLNRFASPESAEEITRIMRICDSHNLRSFIYACQKTVDIFNALDEEYTSDDDYTQAVFWGILFFVFRLKSGEELRWRGETLFSIDLGHEKAPLFKYCYDYIIWQTLDTSNVRQTYDTFKELALFDETKSDADSDIETIRDYQVHTEEEILTALHNIDARLAAHADDISFYKYGTIAVYSIILKELLGCNIDAIKRLLITNLKSKGNKLQIESVFRTAMSDRISETAKEEYNDLRQKMTDALQDGNLLFDGFDYRPDQVNDLYKAVVENKEQIRSRESFARDLDMNKLAKMFADSTQVQKKTIRDVFLDVYDTSVHLSGDCEKIQKLLDLIKQQRNGNVGDKIQQLQYDFFIENLTTIIEKLS